MSEILDKTNLPLAIGAHVGVVFEVIRLGEADEQSNVTLRAVDPCPGSNFKPEISLHGTHCVLLGEGVPKTGPVNGTPVAVNPPIVKIPAEEEEHEETGGAGGGPGDDGGKGDPRAGAKFPEGGSDAGLAQSEKPAAPAANEKPADETGGVQTTDTPPAA